MKLFPAKCHERATLRNYDVKGKQFIVTREMLTAVARDQRWPDLVNGISARFSKFSFVLFCYITNHSMAGPLGNSEFCFPRISIRFSGNKIHCPPRDQSLNVNYLTLVERTEISIFLYLWCHRIASWFVNCLTDWLTKTLVKTRGMITMKRKE